MTESKRLFLQAVNAALKNEYVDWAEPVSRECWEEIFKLAEIHRMLPMVFQAVYRCPAARLADGNLMGRCRFSAMQMVALQAQKTAEFAPVLEALRKADVQPLVVKGITCRELYPNPDHRLSSDEDVLIHPAAFARCHEALTELGFSTRDPEDMSYELSYLKQGSPLYLEIHRSLFPPESLAYGDLNRFFPEVYRRSVEKRGVPTLCPTDHMLFLLCHAFKHFLHSGFGLRQVCDLILFANHYGPEVDWPYVLECCRSIHAEQFAAGLFRIGWKYLNFSLEDSRFPLQWQAIYVDEGPLLEDILQAGVYGTGDEDRLHSSNITLQAVISQKQGTSGSGSLLQTVFPPRDVMERKYPYLKNKPLLLPIAWTDRIIRYGKSGSKASSTLRIGNERVALLKRYGVITE